MPHYGKDDYDDHDDVGVGLIGALSQNWKRSKKSREMDSKREATVTTDYEAWSENPDEFDFKGVDEKSGLWD